MDLSVVVISWQMRDLLERMLQSLYEWTQGLTFEVLCYDNGSSDGTADMVRSKFPQVQLFCNEKNLGVAPARNLGLARAKGEFVAILDADLELVENALFPIVEFLRNRPEVGMAGCRLVFPDGTTQTNAKRFPGPLALLSRRVPLVGWLDSGKTLSHHEMREWTRADTRRVDYLIGACQVFRRSILDQVGLLDDKIFYGPEDIDFCYRISLQGWEIWWLHEKRIIHHEQRVTRKRLFNKITFKHLQALLYFFRKHGIRYPAKLKR